MAYGGSFPLLLPIIAMHVVKGFCFFFLIFLIQQIKGSLAEALAEKSNGARGSEFFTLLLNLASSLRWTDSILKARLPCKIGSKPPKSLGWTTK